MKALLVDVGATPDCAPLTSARPLSDCRVANRRLADLQRESLRDSGFVLAESAAQGVSLFVRGDAWLSSDLLKHLAKAVEPVVVTDADAGVLAWVGDSVEPSASAEHRVADAGSFSIRYPWDLLRVNEIIVGGLSEDVFEGAVDSGVHMEGHVIVGRGTRIMPGVFIEGNAIIGEDCKIGPNCYVRGSTSIGDHCHIGHAVEIKNSIIMDGTSIGHLTYCGDSIVGEKVNLGAGTITANFRHDGRTHRSHVDGRLVETGRTKFGTVIGDGVHTGIHTSIYPGRKLWPGVCTRPGTVVAYDVMR